MKRSGLLVCMALCALVMGTAAAVHADSTFTFYAATTSATFNRPDSLTTLDGTLVHYTNPIPFFPNEDSTCSVYSTQEGNDFDGVILLYDGGFNAGSPLNNLIALDDDFSSSDGGLGIGTSAIERIPLQFVHNYYLVLAGYDSPDVGTATITVNCSDPATRVIAGDGGFPSYDGHYTELLGGRFRVSATWRNFSSVTGAATFVPLGSNDSGIMWFFQPQNFEVLIKAVNACTFNNRYWIFYAATTNVEFTINVYDTANGHTRSYFNPLGTSLATAVTDTDAFTCP